MDAQDTHSFRPDPTPDIAMTSHASASSPTPTPRSVSTRLPPPPGDPEDPENMRSWLRAKAADDRRISEEEKTRQEQLRLEQRKVDHAMLTEALRAGVPGNAVPAIFSKNSVAIPNAELPQILRQAMYQMPPSYPQGYHPQTYHPGLHPAAYATQPRNPYTPYSYPHGYQHYFQQNYPQNYPQSYPYSHSQSYPYSHPSGGYGHGSYAPTAQHPAWPNASANGMNALRPLSVESANLIDPGRRATETHNQTTTSREPSPETARHDQNSPIQQPAPRREWGWRVWAPFSAQIPMQTEGPTARGQRAPAAPSAQVQRTPLIVTDGRDIPIPTTERDEPVPGSRSLEEVFRPTASELAEAHRRQQEMVARAVRSGRNTNREQQSDPSDQFRNGPGVSASNADSMQSAMKIPDEEMQDEGEHTSPMQTRSKSEELRLKEELKNATRSYVQACERNRAGATPKAKQSQTRSA